MSGFLDLKVTTSILVLFLSLLNFHVYADYDYDLDEVYQVHVEESEHEDQGNEHHITEEHEGHHGHTNKRYVAILFFFVMITTGALFRTLLVGTKIPYTVALLLVGLVFGVVNCVTDLGYLGESINQWEHIDPHLLLFAFLPGLVFESAFSMEWHTLWKCLGQVLTMATFGVVIGQILLGSFCVIVLPYDWSWQFGLMVGAILAATDPVAVVSLLKDLGASKKLATTIEGESLFNDGTAIVLFILFLDLSKGEHFTAGEIVVFFLQVAGGGMLIGLLGALATLWFIGRVYNDALVDISLTLTCCYLTFFVAEEVCGASGVLAVVILGSYMGAVGKPYFQVRKEVEEFLHHFWEMVGYGANTVIFILAGVIIGGRLCDDIDLIKAEDFAWSLLLYVFVNLARALTVAILFPILQRLGYGLDFANASVIVWGGLRGAVGLALAMVVTGESYFQEQDRVLVLFHIGMIVILTLLVNGSTTGMVLHWVGLDQGSANREKVLGDANRELSAMTMSNYLDQGLDELLGHACFDTVKSYVSSLRQAEGSRKKRGKQGEGPGGGLPTADKLKRAATSKMDLKQQMVSDLRARYLQTTKKEYLELLESGNSTKGAILKLTEAVDIALDETSSPLSDWTHLRAQFETLDTSLFWIGLKLFPLPVTLKQLLDQSTILKIQQKNLQAAVTFITAARLASSHYREMKSSDKNEAMVEVLKESASQCQQAVAYVQELKREFPLVASNLKTKEVTRCLLHKQIEFVHHAAQSGLLEESEVNTLMMRVEHDLKHFLLRPPRLQELTPADVLASIPLITSLATTSPALCQAVCKEAEVVEFQPGTVVLDKGSADDKILLVGRGIMSFEAKMPASKLGDSSTTVKIRLGSRAHPSGWALNTLKVLKGCEGEAVDSPVRVKEKDEENDDQAPSSENLMPHLSKSRVDHEFAVRAETLVMGFRLEGDTIRKIVQEHVKEKHLMWRCCAGILLESSLRSDLTVPLTPDLQQRIAEGEVSDIPEEITVDPKKEMVILLDGRVYAPVWGSFITAPCLLTEVANSPAAQQAMRLKNEMADKARFREEEDQESQFPVPKSSVVSSSLGAFKSFENPTFQSVNTFKRADPGVLIVVPLSDERKRHSLIHPELSPSDIYVNYSMAGHEPTEVESPHATYTKRGKTLNPADITRAIADARKDAFEEYEAETRQTRKSTEL